MKIADLTYKQRKIAVLLLSVAFLWLLWDRKISLSVALYNEWNVVKSQASLIEDADYHIRQLKAEIDMVEAQIGRGDQAQSELQNDLLVIVSEYCRQNGVVVVEFSEPHRYAANGFKFMTETIRLEGAFIDIVRLTRHLEKNIEGLRIASIEYMKVLDRKAKKNKLYAKLYVQSTYRS